MKRAAEIKMSNWFGAFPVRLHVRNDLHLLRKCWHMMIGLVIGFVYLNGLPRGSCIAILSVALAADLFVEFTRLRVPSVNEKIVRVWAPLMRASEIRNLSATPHYLLASILSIAIFPKAVAVLSIFYLACGDPIASLFGILYGRHGVRFSNGKSSIGTMAGVITCSLITFLFLKSLSLPDATVLGVSLIGGLAGGLTEHLPFDVDDNFTIPLVSGFVLWLCFIAFGI